MLTEQDVLSKNQYTHLVGVNCYTLLSRRAKNCECSVRVIGLFLGTGLEIILWSSKSFNSLVVLIILLISTLLILLMS